MVDSAFTICSLAMAFVLVGLNVYLSMKILNVADLTCDGSVAVGGCLYGALVIGGISPVIAFLIAVFCGFAAGMVTASFSSK